MNLAENPGLVEYLATFSRVPGSRYPNFLSKRIDSDQYAVEIQDIYLTDPRMPSSTGAVPPHEHGAFVDLAVRLQFLRPQNYTLTDRGQALRELGRLAQGESGSAGSLTNPLLLSAAERVFFLYILLLEDFDLQQRLYQHLLRETEGESFSRSDVGKFLPDVFDDLANSLRRQVRSGEDKLRLRKLQETANGLRASKGKGVDEQYSSFRLESFVDLGLFRKLASAKYVYAYTTDGRALIDRIADAEASNFLRTSAMGVIAQSQGIAGERITQPRAIGALLAGQYPALRSGLGYASYDECAVLACAQSLTSDRPRFFELADAEIALRELQKEFPRQVRLGIRRFGGLSYVKFDEQILRLLSDQQET